MAVTGGATLRQVVYDLLGDFKKSQKDADITVAKLAYWVLVHADRLRMQHIEKRSSGAFTVPFEVDVVAELRTKYFDLPANIYDLDNDKGIDYLTYAPSVDMDLPPIASISFTRTHVSKVSRLYYRDDERPTPANPYFYTLKNRVMLLGIENVNVLKLEVGLITSLQVSGDIDLDQYFDFPQELIPVLKRQVLDMGRFVLLIPKDLKDDGVNEVTGQIPTNKLISVNDLSANQDNQQQ